MSVTKVKAAMIWSATLSYVVLLVFSALASKGKSSSLYPVETGKVSRAHETGITPSSSTFSIWGFIFFYQCVWLAYLVSIICRKRAADILPAEFFILFIVSCVSTIGWLLVWSRQQLITAFVMLSVTGLSLMGCLYYAAVSLFNYVLHTPEQELHAVDVWCHRLLVVNGLLFYTTWVSIATILNLTIVLQYSMGVSPSNAAVLALTLLACGIIIWFGFENFTAEKFTRYFFTEYIVLLSGIGGMLSKHWIDGSGNQSFILCIFILTAIFMALRLIVVFMKERIEL